jgi:hypothetical protein
MVLHFIDGVAQLWHVGRVAHPDMSEQKHANKVSAAAAMRTWRSR